MDKHRMFRPETVVASALLIWFAAAALYALIPH